MSSPTDEQQRYGLATLLASATEVRPERHVEAPSRPAQLRPVSAPARPRPPAATGLDRLAARLLSGPRPLMGVLLLQAGLSLRLVWSNTAFSDESLYLWSGRLELQHFLLGAKIPAFQTYFSGAPVIYPVLDAIADAYGGLVLARLLSMAFMLGATALLYSLTSRLFGHGAALSGSALFAVLGPVQVLGAFATYDAMAIFLLALGARLAIQASGRLSELALLSAGVTLAVADATKYATTLWTPIVIALAALAAPGHRAVFAVLRGARLAAYVAVPLTVALFRYGGPSYLRGVMFTTLDRQAQSTHASAAVVLGDSFTWIGIVFVLALAGTVSSFTGSWRVRLLCATLTIATLLAPLHQAQIHTTTSLHKHVVFGAWFGAAAAGFLLSRLRKVNPVKAWRASAAAIGVTLFIAYPQATQMFVYGWPNTTQMITALNRIIPRAGCPCLVAEQNAVRFYLPRLSAYAITGPYAFYYWSQTEQKELHGLAAYEAAITAHYFSVVEIDPAENAGLYEPVTRTLRATPGYKLEDSIRIDHWGRRTMQIWRYVGGSS